MKILTSGTYAMYDVITEVTVVKIFSEKKILHIDSKWSEMHKKHETADRFPP